MDDDQVQLARVLSLPPAPDAIELRHLRAFVAVAEELNFGRAATRLYLSQPALSRQIRALERLVGSDLLRRSTHQVELTVAGEALLDRARRLLAAVDEAVSVTRSVGGELAGRMAQLWEPFVGVTAPVDEMQELRSSVEALHAQFPVPEQVHVRPVNAGGVPSLVLAPGPDHAATVLYLHGGGYVSGSAFGYRHLAGALAAAAETALLVPDYRLAPEHPFPAALEDATSAYLWMLDRGTRPAEVAVVGDSSGGGLTMSLLISLRQQGLPMPGRAVLLSPWLDLSCRHLGQRVNEEPALTEEQGLRFAEAYLNGHPETDPVVDPLGADLRGLPPMLLQVATGDSIRPEVQQFADRARSQGVDARVELYPVSTHNFQVFWSFLPEARDSLHQAGEFLRAPTASIQRESAP